MVAIPAQAKYPAHDRGWRHRITIVPLLEGPFTTQRNDTHIVVTEYGWADIKGKSMRQRANALIGLAHPGFRDELANSLR